MTRSFPLYGTAAARMALQEASSRDSDTQLIHKFPWG